MANEEGHWIVDIPDGEQRPTQPVVRCEAQIETVDDDDDSKTLPPCEEQKREAPVKLRTFDTYFTPVYSGRYVTQTQHLIGSFKAHDVFVAYKALAIRMAPATGVAQPEEDGEEVPTVYLIAIVMVDAGQICIKSHDNNRSSGLAYTLRVPSARVCEFQIPTGLTETQATHARLARDWLTKCFGGVSDSRICTILNPDCVVIGMTDTTEVYSGFSILQPSMLPFSRDVPNALGSGVHIQPSVSEANRVIQCMRAVCIDVYSRFWIQTRDAFNQVRRQHHVRRSGVEVVPPPINTATEESSPQDRPSCADTQTADV